MEKLRTEHLKKKALTQPFKKKKNSDVTAVQEKKCIDEAPEEREKISDGAP
jgi:hypothetical protein